MHCMICECIQWNGTLIDTVQSIRQFFICQLCKNRVNQGFKIHSILLISKISIILLKLLVCYLILIQCCRWHCLFPGYHFMGCSLNSHQQSSCKSGMRSTAKLPACSSLYLEQFIWNICMSKFYFFFKQTKNTQVRNTIGSEHNKQ